MTMINCPRCGALIGKCKTCEKLKEIDHNSECLDCYLVKVKD